MHVLLVRLGPAEPLVREEGHRVLLLAPDEGADLLVPQLFLINGIDPERSKSKDIFRPIHILFPPFSTYPHTPTIHLQT